MPDDDGYPTDDELDEIGYWPMGPADALVRRLEQLWWIPAFGFRLAEEAADGQTVRRLSLSTGGWSGNEELIGALRKSMGRLFWTLNWVSHRRGGHYEFEISDQWWSQAEPSGFSSRALLSLEVQAAGRIDVLRANVQPHWSQTERMAYLSAIDDAKAAVAEEPHPEVLAVVLAADPVLRGGAAVLARDEKGRRYLRHWRQGDPPIESGPAHIELLRTEQAAQLGGDGALEAAREAVLQITGDRVHEHLADAAVEAYQAAVVARAVDSDASDLTRQHFASRHGGWLDPDLTPAEVEREHHDDHHGAGRMRGHDEKLRDFDLAKVAQVRREVEGQ